MKIAFTYLLLIAGSLMACMNKSFDEKVIVDVTEYMGTGICDSIPAGSSITEVMVGGIKTLSESDASDVVEVIVEFDFSFMGITKHRKTSLIYLKKNSSYRLASLGDCQYSERLGDFLGD